MFFAETHIADARSHLKIQSFRFSHLFKHEVYSNPAFCVKLLLFLAISPRCFLSVRWREFPLTCFPLGFAMAAVRLHHHSSLCDCQCCGEAAAVCELIVEGEAEVKDVPLCCRCSGCYYMNRDFDCVVMGFRLLRSSGHPPLREPDPEPPKKKRRLQTESSDERLCESCSQFVVHSRCYYKTKAETPLPQNLCQFCVGILLAQCHTGISRLSDTDDTPIVDV